MRWLAAGLSAQDAGLCAGSAARRLALLLCTCSASRGQRGVQGALKGWVPLCEAIVSWHIMRCDGLRHDLMSLMQAFKANLAKVSSYLSCCRTVVEAG